MRDAKILYRVTELDVVEDEVIPITKQVNDVGDLNLFKADFSRQFRVKRTPEMELLLENAGAIGSETTLPYEKLWVRYVAGGVDVISNARLTIQSANALHYTCVITSAIRDVFQTLRNNTINALDLSALDHLWTAEVARDSVLNDEDYQYLLCDFSDDGHLIEVDEVNSRAECDERILRPFVRVKAIMDAIILDNGIYISGDLETDAMLSSLFIPISTLTNTQQSVDSFLRETHAKDLSITQTETSIRLVMANTGDPMFASAFTYRTGITGMHYFQFIFIFGGVLLTNSNYTDVFEYITVDVNDVDTPWVAWGGDNAPIGISLSVNKGEVVRFLTKRKTGEPLDIFWGSYYTFACRKIDPTTIERGSTVNVAIHLPTINQADFFRSIAAYLGYVFSYNPIANEVSSWRINQVLENKAKAADWSDYLSVENSNTLSYRLDYAKINRFKWKPDPDVKAGDNDTFMSVDDDNLGAEKDVLIMPFASTDTVEHSDEEMSRIGWFISQEAGNEQYKEGKNITARMCLRVATTDLAVRYQDSGYMGSNYDLTQSQSRKAMPATMIETVNRNQTLASMLNRTKKVVLNFNLPPDVVKNLDHSIPIYLRQYGQVFFVERVNNWMYGRTCTVELIKI